jgi:hypothetical protein
MNERYNSQFQILLKDLDIKQKKVVSLHNFSLTLLILLFVLSLLVTCPINLN